jgi:hypothetical protein
MDVKRSEHGLLEIDRAHRQGVRANRQLGEQVFASIIRDRRELLPGRCLLGDNRRPREHAAREVLYATGDLASIHLPEREESAKTKREDTNASHEVIYLTNSLSKHGHMRLPTSHATTDGAHS